MCLALNKITPGKLPTWKKQMTICCHVVQPLHYQIAMHPDSGFIMTQLPPRGQLTLLPALFVSFSLTSFDPRADDECQPTNLVLFCLNCF